MASIHWNEIITHPNPSIRWLGHRIYGTDPAGRPNVATNASFRIEMDKGGSYQLYRRTGTAEEWRPGGGGFASLDEAKQAAERPRYAACGQERRAGGTRAGRIA